MAAGNAVAELKLGDAAATEPLLRKAAELNPDDSSTLYLLAKALKSEGHSQQAADTLHKVELLHSSALDAERGALRDAGVVKDAGVELSQ
jgi:cytochrome c-type biogenesis protein CcmH/NrfG